MYGKDVILLGYSGHGFVVADAAIEMGLNIIGYTEKVSNHFNPFGFEYLGDESNLDFKGWELDVDFIIGIGDNCIRKKIYSFVIDNGKRVISVIHPRASISKNVFLGEGVFVNRNVSINAFARIGNNVILNTGCVIEHNCILEDNIHVAPGAVLAGNVKVGARSFIGANAIIKQGVLIGEDVIVGAGTVVIKNIPSKKKVVGNPHRFI